MANRYYLPLGASWTTSSTAAWSTAAPVTFTASCSGTALTTVGSPALVVGMTVSDNSGNSLGTVVSGSGNSWVVSSGGTRASMTMNAATVGASAPTVADDIFFQGVASYSVTVTGGLCRNITVSAGTVTFNGSTTGPTIRGSMSLVAGTVWSIGAALTTTFNATTTGQTVTTNGVTLSSQVTFNGVGGGWTLGSALTLTQTLTITNGSFNSGNFAISTSFFSSSNSNTRSISLGSSTVTISGNLSTALNLGTITNLTWNADTSQINLSGSGTGIASGGLTFNNVSFTSGVATGITITGDNTFTTLAFASRTSVGLTVVSFNNTQTIGTLTLAAGTTAAYRTLLTSDILGTQRTLQVTTLTAGAADYDFRDIAITGSAAPLSVTRAGDCKGNDNSSINFPAAKTVYYRNVGTANWGQITSGSWAAGLSITASCSGTALTTTGSPTLVVGQTIISATGVSLGTISSGSGNSWVVTIGGTYPSQTMLAIRALDNTQFPLAQDTAVFAAGVFPTTGSTININSSYNIGTVDMSRRTTNTMTLATGTTLPSIYGNWINGSGISFSGSSSLTFMGRTSQTITTASATFTQPFTINSPDGSVTLEGSFNTSASSSNALNILQGTFDATTYNVTLSGAASGVATVSNAPRTIAIGSGTWSITGTGGWNASISTNLTVTGTGIISLTSTSAKSFQGGGIQTYPTIRQGGTGTLTISGSNKFANITNTAIGSVLFTGGTTNEFNTFSLSGVSGNLLTLGSTNTTQAILKKPGVWYMGANSTNAGNNTNLTFTAGGTIDYLTVSYINGLVTSQLLNLYWNSNNSLQLYLGSQPVNSLYYGSTKIWG